MVKMARDLAFSCAELLRLGHLILALPLTQRR